MSNEHSFDVPYHSSDKVMVTDKNGTPLHLHDSGHLIHPETGQSHGTFSWSKQDGRHMLQVNPKHSGAAYEAGSGEATHPKVAAHAPPMSKGDGDGEFRGGDPEEIEIKRQEKELDKGVKKTQKLPRDAKKLVTAMLHRIEGGHVSKKPKVAKAQPGEEVGAFRGGDPEEIRIKREEKLQEMEDSGELEDQDEGGEEVTPEEIEEAEEEEKQKQEDQGKSLLVAKAMAHIAGQQVSPVNTFGDYDPRDANGDPVSLKNQQVDEKYKEPAPVRPGANQHRLWSEVVGTKIPLTGNPVHELRRFHGQGRTGEMVQEAKMLSKAIHRHETGLLSVWRDDFVGGQFYTGEVNKGIGDAPAASHKYVKRWYENGKWNYEYQDEPHANHGMHAIHDINGHSIEVHPGFKQAGQPGSAAKAYEYSRRAHLAEGGSWDVKVWDPKRGEMVDRKLEAPGTKDDKGNIPHDKEGMPQFGWPKFVDPATGKKKRAGETTTAIESNLRQPQTVYDPYGDPWMHYQVRQSKANPDTLGVPRVMFDHRSRFNPDIDPNDPDYIKRKHTPSHKKTIDELRQWVGEQQSYMEFLKEQEGKSQMHPEDRKAHTADWKPTFGHQYDAKTGRVVTGPDGKPAQIEHKVTNALERGEVGNWSWKDDHLFVKTGGERGPLSRKQQVPHSKRAVHHGVALHVPEEHQAQFMKDMMDEHGAALRGVAHQVLRRSGLRTWDDHDLGTSEGRHNAKNALVAEALGALDDTINSYNPKDPNKSRRLSEHIQRKSDDVMKRALEAGMGASSGEKRHSARRASELARNIERKKKLIEQDVATGNESGFAKLRQKTLPELEAALAQHQAAAGIEKPEVTMKPTGGSRRAGMGPGDDSGDEGESLAARPGAGGQERQSRVPGGVGMPMGTEFQDAPGRAAALRGEAAPTAAMTGTEKLHLDKFDAAAKQMGGTSAELVHQLHAGLQQNPTAVQRMFQQNPYLKTGYELLTKEGLPELGKAINYYALLMAMDTLSKAEEDEGDGEDPDQMHYAWREGEPGAYKYMYKDGFGEHVRGTNAPEGHPHHDSEAGPPEVHPHEPTPESAPHMFDQFGRKLHRPAPEGAELETNSVYDPDVHHWAHKYEDPETGNEEFISLHRDRIGSHRLALNEDIRQVDSQLEKVRGFYQRLIRGRDLRQRALGLVLALVDQARALSDGDDSGLLSMKIKDVSLSGNSFKMKYKDASGSPHMVVAVLDSTASGVLNELAQGKKSWDKVFDIEGQPLQQREVAQVLDQKFGLQLKQFRTYHGTELFSKEFQRLAGDQASLEPKDLPRLADKAYAKVMRMMGHRKVDPELAKKTIVDPVTVEALFMSAIHHHDPKANEAVEKAYKLQGRTIFQGLPVSIENRKGSVRHWKDKDSKTEGKTKMHHAYGYVRGTKGVDGDEVDVYIGPHKEADKVFVVHQMKLPDFKEFDEDKCMLGFKTAKEAKAAYLKQYDNPKFFGSMTIMSMDEFKDKIKATKKRPQMIKGECSVCEKSWGECDHSQAIEKAFGGSSDTGQVTWTVTVSHPKRTPDEKMFGDWIHSHPQHEHDQHWAAFKQATRVEDLPEPDHGREYAHGGDQPDREHPVFDQEEAHHFGAGGEDEGVEEEEPEAPEEETAKSLLDSMIQAAS